MQSHPEPITALDRYLFNKTEVKMHDLSVYFRNPFSDNTIPDANLKKFTEDHLNMMTANNESGQFTTMIAETVDVYNAYFGSSADESTTADVQTQLNQSMRNIFEEFITLVTRKEPEIKNVWGVESSVYKEFYPDGLAEYNNATIVDVEKLMNRYINAANNHMQELGQTFIDLFNGIKTNYTAAREAQLRKISEPNTNTTITASRSILERQLAKNLLTFAIVYINSPEKGLEFFNTNILARPDEGPSSAPQKESAVEQKEPIK